MQKKILFSLLLIFLLLVLNGCTGPTPPPICEKCTETHDSDYGCIPSGKQLCPDGSCVPQNTNCPPECEKDSDCKKPDFPDELGNPSCLQTKCVNGKCDYPTVPGAECVYHYDCPNHPVYDWKGICGYNCKCTYAG